MILNLCIITQVLADAKKKNFVSVGIGKKYLFPSVAAQFIKDGDIIEIDANGFYDDDTVIWKNNNITIRGVNGRPKIKSNKRLKKR